MKGAHLIKVWAKTQGAIALSSMEPKLYSAVYGATEVKWNASLGADASRDFKCSHVIDSSAALGFM